MNFIQKPLERKIIKELNKHISLQNPSPPLQVRYFKYLSKYSYIYSVEQMFFFFYKISHSFDIPDKDNMQMYKKGYHRFRISNDSFIPFHRRILQ